VGAHRGFPVGDAADGARWATTLTKMLAWRGSSITLA
jgi:hypothetical protein